MGNNFGNINLYDTDVWVESGRVGWRIFEGGRGSTLPMPWCKDDDHDVSYKSDHGVIITLTDLQFSQRRLSGITKGIPKHDSCGDRCCVIEKRKVTKGSLAPNNVEAELY